MSPPDELVGRLWMLKGKRIVKPKTLEEWLEWWGGRRPIGVMSTRMGECEVSTIFLAIDHSLRRGKPILFETAYLTKEGTRVQARYSTWAKAMKGHKWHVAFLKKYPWKQQERYNGGRLPA